VVSLEAQEHPGNPDLLDLFSPASVAWYWLQMDSETSTRPDVDLLERMLFDETA